MRAKNLLPVVMGSVAALFALQPVWSDPIVASESSSSSSSSSSVSVQKAVRLKFRERLSNLLDQINLGTSKGWISDGDGAAFKNRHDSLLAKVDTAEKAGWPEDQVDSLEKDVTALNADVSSASTKGMNAKSALPAAESKTTTTISEAAGTKSGTKTTTTKKTAKTAKSK